MTSVTKEMEILKKSVPRQRRALVLAAVLFWLGNYFFVPTFPTYCRSAGASVAAVGVIASAYGLAQLLVRIPLGMVSDRIGRQKVFILTLGFGCLGIAAAAMALYPTPGVLFAGRLLSGISASAWVSFTILYAGYYDAEQGQKAIAIMTLTSVVGPLIANFTGGAVSETLGPSVPFWMALGISLIGGLVMFWIPEQKSTAGKAVTVRELLSVGKDRTVLTVSLIAALLQFAAFGAGTTFAPLLAEQKLGASDTELGILAAIMAASGIPATLLAGTAAIRRRNTRGVMLICLLINAASCAAFPFVQTLWGVYLVQFLSGFARNLVFPICMNLSIAGVEDTRKGSAMGFFQALYSLGIFLGPLAIGNPGSSDNALTGGFLLSAGIVFVGAALVFLLPRNPSAGQQQTESNGVGS